MEIDFDLKRQEVINKLSSLESQVTHGDRTVQFDLRQAGSALDVLASEEAKADAATTPRARRLRITTVTGL